MSVVEFIPSDFNTLTDSDVTNTLADVTPGKIVRHFFVQLENAFYPMHYGEIFIYGSDENTNIAKDKPTVQSTNWDSVNTYPSSNVVDDDTFSINHTAASNSGKAWLGIDLQSDQVITKIDIWGRNGVDYIVGGSQYARTAPFRVFLYKESEYSDDSTGPLNYNDYTLHTNDFTRTRVESNRDAFSYTFTNFGYSAFSAVIRANNVMTTILPDTFSSITYFPGSSYNLTPPNVPPLPYNITFTPSTGTELTEADIVNTLSNYDEFAKARFFFIQLETQNTMLVYNEIEIYDENGNNIVLNVDEVIQSSFHNSSSYPATHGNDGDLDSGNIWTTDNPGERSWWGVDLGSEKTIAGIRVYGHDNTSYIPGGSTYDRTAPFRIFLYKDYTGSFSADSTGPLNYNDYQLHSDDATKTEIINGNQQVFYYGITAQIGSDISNVGYIPSNLYSNNAIADIDRTFYSSNLPPYNITFTPSSGTELTETDITNTLSNYDGFAKARYFFIQLDTTQTNMTYGEIEIYDENGINIALEQEAIISSTYNANNDFPASKANNGINYKPLNSDTEKDFMHTSSSSGNREWWGVNLGSDKKIAGIRIYTSNHPYSDFNTSDSTNYYPRTAPFRIFLYKDADYPYSSFTDGTGPLDYDNYQLHSSDVTKTDSKNTYQFIFYYGIHAQIGSGSTQIIDVSDSLYSNKAIVDIEQSLYTQNIPPYNITFTPTSGTELTETDITNTLNDYTGFKTAQYVFLQLETVDAGDGLARITISEIEVYDPDGNNIALSKIADTSTHEFHISNLVDGITNTSEMGMQMGSEGERTWVGINLGSNKKIAGIKVYSRRGFYGSGSHIIKMQPHRIYLYDSSEYEGRDFSNGGDSSTSGEKGPIEYDNYSFISDTTKLNGARKITTINHGSLENDGTEQDIVHYGINAQIGSATNKVTSIPDSLYNNTNNAIVDINYDNYLGFGNYYHMDVSMHYSDLSYGVYLPTVTFTTTNSNGWFTKDMRIAQLAEQGITGFYEADFADNVTDIRTEAFFNDTKVCVVTINEVTSIHSAAFKSCSNLRAITLDTAVDTNSNKYKLTSLGNNAFEGCSALKQLYIPDTVTDIAESLCYECTNLEVAVMGYGIKRGNTDAKIGNYAFFNCWKLKYFIIPDTVTIVGSNAFGYCTSLEHLLISDTQVGYSSTAFTTINSGCIVTLPYGVLTGGTGFTGSPFNGNTLRRYQVVTFNPNGSVLSNSEVNAQTSGITGYYKAIINNTSSTTFTTFGYESFRTSKTNNDNLVAISIPSTVTTLRYSCFRGQKLLSAYIPKSVSTLTTYNDEGRYVSTFDDSELYQCVLESGGTHNTLNYGSDVAAILRNCSNLRAVIMHPNITTLTGQFCNLCINLQLVNIFQKNAVNSLSHVGYTNHFQSCTSLTEIHIFTNNFAGLGTSSRGIFQNCSGLKRIYVYNNHNAQDGHLASNLVSPNIFYVYSGSTTIMDDNYSYNRHAIFKNTVTSIPDSKFHNNDLIKTITFEHGGTTPLNIQKKAFRHCGGITDGAHDIKWNDREFTFSSTPHNSGDSGIFEDCTNLTSFFIPKRFPCIPSRFLHDCTNLENVYWDKDSSVTTIYTAGFNNTKISHFHIPASVVSIGIYAFNVNNNLTKITFGAGSRLKFIDGFGYAQNNWSSSSISTNGLAYLSNIVLPNSIKSAAIRTFNNSFKHRTLDTMVIPSSMEYIPEMFINVYGDVASINTIYIPNSITNVAGPRRHQGYKTQGYTTNIRAIRTIARTKYYVPSHLNPLNAGAFNNATDITYYDFVNFPATNGTVNGLYHSTYYHAEIDEGTITVGVSLGNATKLISVNFPLTLTTISQNSFKDNVGLTYVTFHEGTRLTSIESGAFQNCRNIFDIALPESLTKIGENAFANCINLATVKIPYNVTDISLGAFTGCTNLEYVSISDTLYNDISNNINSYFSGKHVIKYHVVSTVEFSATSGNELTSANVTAQLKDVGLYKGSIYTPTFASSVLTINPDVYVDFPEFLLYSRGFPQIFQTAGSAGSIHNTTIQSQVVGAWYKDGDGTRSGDFPIVKSIPDYNLYNYNTGYADINDDDNLYLVMPGFTLILYNNLYDELNTYNTNQTDVGTTQILDNSLGTKAKLFTANPANTTSSAVLLFLNKIIHYKSYI